MTPRGSEGSDSDITSIGYYNLINMVIRWEKGSGNHRYTVIIFHKHIIYG